MPTDDEQCVLAFTAAFDALRAEPMLLYGLGKNTKLLLDNVEGFNIVGLMDRANVPDTAFNMRVYTVSEAAKAARIIVMVAPKYAQMQIFPRIVHLLDAGVRIFNMTGEEWTREDAPGDEHPALEASKERLYAEIARHHVISFDVFDTLIMRRCHLPSMVFDQVERRFGTVLGFPFRRARQEAQAAVAARQGGVYTLGQVYDYMRLDTGADEAAVATLMRMELECELENAVARADVVGAMRRAMELGKTVILVSDMYLTAQHMVPLLEKCGIDGYSDLLISCEAGSTKRSGSLWELVIKRFPGQRILHIGDDPDSDGEQCRLRGITAFGVRQAAQTLESSSMRSVAAWACAPHDLIALGLIERRLFSNAFAPRSTNGVPVIANPQDVGYVMFGPLTLGFLLWLVEMTERGSISDILFLSRDGYILKRAYEEMIARNPDFRACKAHYLYTSRRVSALANIARPCDIDEMFLRFDFQGTLGQALVHLFGAEPRQYEDDRPLQRWDAETLIAHVHRYYDADIMHNAEIMRERCTRYLEALPISGGRDCITVDLRSSGSSVFHLNRLMGWDLRGYNFLRRIVTSSLFDSAELSRPYLHDSGVTLLGRLNLTSACDFAECVYTAPEGMLVGFDESMGPLFEDVTNRLRDYSLIEGAHEGIMAFIRDFFDSYRSCDIPRLSREFIDECFGLLPNGKCALDAALSGMFVHYEYLRNEIRELL